MTFIRYLWWSLWWRMIGLLVTPLLRWQEWIGLRLEVASKKLNEHNLVVIVISGRRYVEVDGKIIPIDNEV